MRTVRCWSSTRSRLGLGKTGRFSAAEHDGIAPDIVVLGKALGGGMLPIAACWRATT